MVQRVSDRGRSNRGKGGTLGRLIGGSMLTIMAGLLLAGAVHIIVVLSIPAIAETPAIARMDAANLPDLTFTEIDSDAARGLSVPVDRQFRVVACPFDLAQTPVAVSVPLSSSFWTLAIFDDASHNIYSLNDRLTVSAGLELVMVNASQLARLREIGAQELEKRIVVELDFDQGFTLFRVFDEGTDNMAEAFVESLRCEPFEPDPDAFAPSPPAADDNRV